MNIKNDNAVKIALSLQHSDPAQGELSDTGVSISYPHIDREAANLLQFETAFQTLLIPLRSTMTGASMKPDGEERLRMYGDFVGRLISQLQEMKSASSQPQTNQEVR